MSDEPLPRLIGRIMHENEWVVPPSLCIAVAEAIVAAGWIPPGEMRDRELHHFETEQMLEKVRAWCNQPRYKISGQHDTWDSYHEGIERGLMEVLALIDDEDPT